MGIPNGVSLIRQLRHFAQGDGALRPLRTRLSDRTAASHPRISLPYTFRSRTSRSYLLWIP